MITITEDAKSQVISLLKKEDKDYPATKLLQAGKGLRFPIRESHITVNVKRSDIWI